MFFVQVGLGRGWEAWIVVNEYYATMPLVGFFIIISIILYLINNYIVIKKYHILLLYLALIILIIYSFKYNYPGENYIKKIMYQKEYMRDLGRMTCGKLRSVNHGDKIYLEHKMPFAKLKNATEIFRAPQTFVDSMSNDTFIMLSIKAASSECNEETSKISNIKILDYKDKYEKNEEANFYNKYYYNVN